MEKSNLPDKEFKIKIVNMLTDLRRRMVEHSKNFNKEIENVKKSETEVITEMQNTLEGFYSRMDETEEQISELEDKAMENAQTEQRNERIKRSEDTLRDLWENIMQITLHYRGPGRRIERKGLEKLFKEIIAENFPNLGGKKTTRSRKPTEFQIR